MVRRIGWRGSRGRPERWRDPGTASVPLLPMPLPPPPLPPSRGPGGGRLSMFSLSPTPHARSTLSSFPTLGAQGTPCQAGQAPGPSQPQPRLCAHAAPATPPMQVRPTRTPVSESPTRGTHSTMPPASATPSPAFRGPQEHPGLRIGPLIPEQDYERLGDCDPEAEGSQDSPLHGEDLQPLLHMPEGLRGSWHHIQNLDTFFTNVYNYHQRNGFACILVEDFFQLGQFVFIIALTTFLLCGVNYDVLFDNGPSNSTGAHHKVTMMDAILPLAQFAQRIRSRPLLVLLLVLAAVFWLFQLLCSVRSLFSFWDIRVFYRDALHMSSEELRSLPWAEVQARLLALQRREGLSVRPLTELDVHHRLLRYTNYLVALANKGLLPGAGPGGVSFLSRGLAFNAQLLLFRGPCSLFRGGWALPEAYKRRERRAALAARWRRTVLLLAAANLALSPLVLAWQLLLAFYSRAEALRRRPRLLCARAWSRLARLQLRHFNELPHELRARLARAHRPASAFLRAAAPPAPLRALLARQLVFFAGAPLAVLLALTVYDEDVLAVQHVLAAATLLGLVVSVASSFIPDEQSQGGSAQALLQAALAHMHYLPGERGAACEASAYRQMARLLQYQAVSLLEEILSPLLTPLVLLFWFRPRALEFIDFFHHFTVDVAGVGDICSFALMDVRRHGHPQWMSAGQTEASPAQRAEDGKTELSLTRFSLAHPRWRPPGHSSKFLGHLRGRLQQDAATWATTSARSPPIPRVLSDSSSSSSSSPPLPEAFLANLLVHPLLPPRDLSPTAPCPPAATASLLASISRISQDPSCVSPGGTGGQKLTQLPELASAEMSLHAIYLHQLHQQQQQESWGEASTAYQPWSSPLQTPSPDEEKPSWSSDGSSPASSPREQWHARRTLFPVGFQEPQKEPGQPPGAV